MRVMADGVGFRLAAGGRLLGGAAALSLIFVLGPDAGAVQKTFVGTSTNPSVNFWDTAGSWSPSGVPTVADDALFNSTSTYFVRMGTTSLHTANTATISNGDVTWYYGGGTVPLVDINGALSVGFFGTSPKLTIEDGFQVLANSVAVGSSFGGVAELELLATNELTASSVSVGTGSTSGTLTLTGSVDGGIGGTPSLSTSNLTLGGGTSGLLRNGVQTGASPSLRVTNHLQVNGTGTISFDGFLLTGSATIAGQFDRPSGGGDLVMTVDQQLTWNTTDGLTVNESIYGNLVDLQSNLALAGGLLSYGNFSGPGQLSWTDGVLIDTNNLSINGTNPYLPSTLSVTPARDLYVGGVLSIGANAGGDLVGTSPRQIASQTGSLGSGATTDGLGVSASFSTAGGGWLVGEDLTLTDDTGATLTINSGAIVEVGIRNGNSPDMSVAITASPDADVVIGSTAVGEHIVNIDGAGSRLDVRDDIFIGGTKSAAGGQGFVTLTDTGEIVAGDTITVWQGSTLDAQAGTATFATLDVRGLADFRTQSLAPGSGGYALAMNGGTLRADLVDYGNLPFSGFGTIDAKFTTQTDVTATGDLTLGDPTDYNGLSIGGTLNVGAHTVTLNKAGFFGLGSDNLNTVPGSRVAAPNGFQFPAGAVFAGQGQLQGRVASSTGSIIVAEGGLSLGDALHPAGVFLDGELDVNTQTVTLYDANDAVLGSLTTLGDGAGSGGVIIAQNGITLDFGRNLAGKGTVLTPNDPFKPLLNNGHIAGASAVDPITLTGYVKGVGTLDHVVITGTDAPGFSPATVYRGNVTYAGELQIELAGTATGSYDRVIHSGQASLSGGLEVLLFDGFVPSFGDVFEIIDAAGGVLGEFTQVALPSLPGGLLLDVTYTPMSVVLEVVAAGIIGDYNGSGQVEQGDLDLVLQNWGLDSGVNGVPTGWVNDLPAGQIEQTELDRVLQNWGSVATPGFRGVSVPEPGVGLVILGLALGGDRRRMSLPVG